MSSDESKSTPVSKPHIHQSSSLDHLERDVQSIKDDVKEIRGSHDEMRLDMARSQPQLGRIDELKDKVGNLRKDVDHHGRNAKYVMGASAGIGALLLFVVNVLFSLRGDVAGVNQTVRDAELPSLSKQLSSVAKTVEDAHLPDVTSDFKSLSAELDGLKRSTEKDNVRLAGLVEQSTDQVSTTVSQKLEKSEAKLNDRIEKHAIATNTLTKTVKSFDQMIKANTDRIQEIGRATDSLVESINRLTHPRPLDIRVPVRRMTVTETSYGVDLVAEPATVQNIMPPSRNPLHTKVVASSYEVDASVDESIRDEWASNVLSHSSQMEEDGRLTANFRLESPEAFGDVAEHLTLLVKLHEK